MDDISLILQQSIASQYMEKHHRVCIENNAAESACTQCNQFAFKCANKNCKCHELHQNCKTLGLKLDSLFKSAEQFSAQRDLDSLMELILKQHNLIVAKILEWRKTFGWTKSQLAVIEKIADSKKQMLGSELKCLSVEIKEQSVKDFDANLKTSIKQMTTVMQLTMKQFDKFLSIRIDNQLGSDEFSLTDAKIAKQLESVKKQLQQKCQKNINLSKQVQEISTQLNYYKKQLGIQDKNNVKSIQMSQCVLQLFLIFNLLAFCIFGNVWRLLVLPGFFIFRFIQHSILGRTVKIVEKGYYAFLWVLKWLLILCLIMLFTYNERDAENFGRQLQLRSSPSSQLAISNTHITVVQYYIYMLH